MVVNTFYQFCLFINSAQVSGCVVSEGCAVQLFLPPQYIHAIANNMSNRTLRHDVHIYDVRNPAEVLWSPFLTNGVTLLDGGDYLYLRSRLPHTEKDSHLLQPGGDYIPTDGKFHTRTAQSSHR